MAFLEYIRKQIAEFSINISDRMIAHANFYTTPDANPHSMPTPTVSKEIDGGVDSFKAIRLEQAELVNTFMEDRSAASDGSVRI